LCKSKFLIKFETDESDEKKYATHSQRTIRITALTLENACAWIESHSSNVSLPRAIRSHKSNRTLITINIRLHSQAFLAVQLLTVDDVFEDVMFVREVSYVTFQMS
jgi:hypothetical protein